MASQASTAQKIPWPKAPPLVSQDLDKLQSLYERLYPGSSGYSEIQISADASTASQISAYDWLKENPATSRFVAFLDRVPAIRDSLKGELSPCTIWAPTNEAWAHWEIDEEADVELLVRHHIAAYDMPFSRIKDIGNIPTIARPSTLNGPLLLRIRPVDDMSEVDSHARVLEADHRVKNGVIHLVDQVLYLPPSISQLVDLLPEAEFSTLRTLLVQTGFVEELTKAFSNGGTFFVPTDEAFDALHEDIRAYLFSIEGQKLAINLLKYHASPRETLASGIFWHGENKEGVTQPPIRRDALPSQQTASAAQNVVNSAPSSSSPQSAPKPASGKKVLRGRRVFPLPSLFNEEWITVHIARFEAIISMQMEQGGGDVVVQDVMTANGIVHAVSRVVMPSNINDEGITSAERLQRFKSFFTAGAE